MRVLCRTSLIPVLPVLFSYCLSASLFAQADPPAGVPHTVTICDKVQQFEACADWVWNGKDFDYNYGKVSGTGTITRNGPSEVILRRTDTHATWPIKRGDVEYIGSFDSNHSGHGASKYIVKGQPPFVGTWTASFAPMKPVEVVAVEPTLPPPPPAGTPSLAVPLGFEECEGSCMTQHDHTAGAWVFRGTKGDARWPRGSKATLTVERYDANGVMIRREDTPDSNVAGRIAIYYGTMRNGRLEGTEIATTLRGDGTKERKEIPWFATIPVTSYDGGMSADEAVETGGKAAAFRQMPNAFQCFLIAANQGNGRAKMFVGLMYRDGIGVKVDYAEANRWLKVAAVQGDHEAQLALEQMYELGVGVKDDPIQAAKWKHAADTNPAVLAQAQSHKEAREDQQMMFMGMTSILSAALGPRAYVIY